MVVLLDRRSAPHPNRVGRTAGSRPGLAAGRNHFWKGLVRRNSLSEGAALLLTIAHYYTPSGRLIQRDYSHQSLFDITRFARSSKHRGREVDRQRPQGVRRRRDQPDEKYESLEPMPFSAG